MCNPVQKVPDILRHLVMGWNFSEIYVYCHTAIKSMVHTVRVGSSDPNLKQSMYVDIMNDRHKRYRCISDLG